MKVRNLWLYTYLGNSTNTVICNYNFKILMYQSWFYYVKGTENIGLKKI